MSYIERTDGWLFRWRVVYPTGGRLDLESVHFTRLGAQLARLWEKA